MNKKYKRQQKKVKVKKVEISSFDFLNLDGTLLAGQTLNFQKQSCHCLPRFPRFQSRQWRDRNGLQATLRRYNRA
ncbi:MAG: hypothetical protein IKP51_11655 [Treponema sp.]|nr:hypothetical protein [Treponema sp.]